MDDFCARIADKFEKVGDVREYLWAEYTRGIGFLNARQERHLAALLHDVGDRSRLEQMSEIEARVSSGVGGEPGPPDEWFRWPAGALATKFAHELAPGMNDHLS